MMRPTFRVVAKAARPGHITMDEVKRVATSAVRQFFLSLRSLYAPIDGVACEAWPDLSVAVDAPTVFVKAAGSKAPQIIIHPAEGVGIHEGPAVAKVTVGKLPVVQADLPVFDGAVSLSNVADALVILLEGVSQCVRNSQHGAPIGLEWLCWPDLGGVAEPFVTTIQGGSDGLQSSLLRVMVTPLPPEEWGVPILGARS